MAINHERISPITETDLLSMYGTILKLTETDAPELLEAADPGEFAVTEDGKSYLANEPVKTLDFGEGVSSGTVFFVPAYDYAGFTISGTATVTAGDTVDPQSHALYSAALASGAVTVTAITPALS